MGLSKTQLSALTRIRSGGNSILDVTLDDAVCAYLLGVLASDLGFSSDLPELPATLPAFFSEAPLKDSRVDGVAFMPLYERSLALRPDVDAYFACLAKLHKSRLKYERILRAQPTPTIDQVGPRGLLQYGSLSAKALAGLLFWRKWIFDLDNRAGQETGYLFEPIIAYSIGGVPFGSKNSPIKRSERQGGRQVDCVREEDKRAYELKLRVTIAASGQGRWDEELQFPIDAKGSGYTPVLVVLDPTRNEKLDALEKAFLREGGEAFVGPAAWAHLEEQAGATMAMFLEKYVRSPLQSLLQEAPTELPDLNISLRGNELVICIGEERLVIQREANSELATDPDPLPSDISSDIPLP